MTEQERQTFLSWGYPPRDLHQLDEALKEVHLTKGNRRISKKKAREELGDEQYLSGIGRAAFHMTAQRGDISFSLRHWW
ncbi:MAG: hypothetical protein IJS19_00300 [Muribaculaceae bacterium]|nr:hypothetical protein [Muribaculaceae bacterium]